MAYFHPPLIDIITGAIPLGLYKAPLPLPPMLLGLEYTQPILIGFMLFSLITHRPL